MKISDISAKELGLRLNPAELTANSSLMSCAAMGDKDAKKLLERLKENEITETQAEETELPENIDRETLLKLVMTLGSSAWVRHCAVNEFFARMKMSVFADIGCGYTQRGITLSRQNNVRYFGFDLPGVAEEMENAVGKVINPMHLQNRIRYIGADVTDYHSMREAINTKEPLFIVTEALMMYLTEHEMLTVMKNICGLLTEFGGVWVTADSGSLKWNDKATAHIFGNNDKSLGSLAGSDFGKPKEQLIFKNSFVTLEGRELKKFVEDQDFNFRTAPIGRYIEDLRLPDESLRPLYDNTEMLLLTSKSFEGKIYSTGIKEKFRVDTEETEEEVQLSIRGRLDALTSPKLLDEYYELKRKGILLPVFIDMTECPYISSAGIRALMIIYNKEKKQGSFALRNISPGVLDILETTGFADFM